MRERELKRKDGVLWHGLLRSLPMRERELKHVLRVNKLNIHASLPMRERELKPCVQYITRRIVMVAPHAGARMETMCAV